MTLVTPAMREAASAAPPQFWPATRTWTSPPHWTAAVMVLSVLPFREALSCSAMTSAAMIFPIQVLGGMCFQLPVPSPSRGEVWGGGRELESSYAAAQPHYPHPSLPPAR